MKSDLKFEMAYIPKDNIRTKATEKLKTAKTKASTMDRPSVIGRRTIAMWSSRDGETRRRYTWTSGWTG